MRCGVCGDDTARRLGGTALFLCDACAARQGDAARCACADERHLPWQSPFVSIAYGEEVPRQIAVQAVGGGSPPTVMDFVCTDCLRLERA